MHTAKAENTTLILALDLKDALNNVFEYKYLCNLSMVYIKYMHICHIYV